MQRTMKILFIHNDYMRPSGEEHAAQALAGLLEGQGHQVSWYRRSSKELEGKPLKKIMAFFSGFYNPLATWQVKKLIQDTRPDLVQIQNLYPLISPSVLRPIKRAGIPIVMRCPNYRLFCPTGLHLDRKGRLCERCTGQGRELNCIGKNCEKSLIKSIAYALRGFAARKYWRMHKLVDVFIVQTEFQRQKFILNGIPAHKLGIVHGLSPAIQGTKAAEIGDLVTFVGRASPEKGILEFLHAARALPKIPFAVAGRLPEELSHLKRDSPKNVEWLGFLGAKALDETYRRTRIITAPGKWYEGFPNVITRAMQHGKPVITSNLGAMASIVDHGENGWLVEPGNARKLAQAINLLYWDPLRCKDLGNNGREKAAEHYSQGEVYAALLAIYRTVVPDVPFDLSPATPPRPSCQSL